MIDFAESMKYRIISKLKELSDSRRRESQKKYFKGLLKDLYGSGLKPMQAVVRRIMPEFKTASAADAVSTCRLLLETEIFEAQMAGIEILYASREKLNPEKTICLIESWITSGLIANWAAVDSVSTRLAAFCIAKDPALEKITLKWTNSANSWLRRAAAVTYVIPARSGLCHDTVYEIALKLLNDPDEYVNKAMGWVLREAGKADKERLDRFIEARGALMSRTTLRYAVEKHPEEERKAILKKTRQLVQNAAPYEQRANN